MDGVTEKWKIRTFGEDAELVMDGTAWEVPVCLYADEIVLFSDGELQQAKQDQLQSGQKGKIRG